MVNIDLIAFRLGEITEIVLLEPFCIIPESTSSSQSLWIEDILEYPAKLNSQIFWRWNGRHIDTIKTLGYNGSPVIASSENSLTFSEMSQIYIILRGPLQLLVFTGN